jgi:hypothetical protein
MTVRRFELRSSALGHGILVGQVRTAVTFSYAFVVRLCSEEEPSDGSTRRCFLSPLFL